MNRIRKYLATASAAALLGTGLAVVPAIAAPPTSSVVDQAAAAQGWGGICKTTYVYRTTTSSTYVAQYRVTWRWWSDSLTGTTCRSYSTTFVKYVSR
jgi:hypothetical protein